MEHKIEKPMNVVEEATTVLSLISSLCALMMNIDAHDISVRTEDVAQVMDYFHRCLDKQIKALDGIQWT